MLRRLFGRKNAESATATSATAAASATAATAVQTPPSSTPAAAAAAKPLNGEAPRPAPAASAPLAGIPREKIAQRAYELWVNRGRPHGTSHHDWLEAEAQLRAELHRPAADADPKKSR